MNTLTTITETNPCFLCCFCKSGSVDDINLGQLFMYEGVVTHYFCMLFSAALSQHGKDNEGILGFLPQDIMAEVRRSWRLKCNYCNMSGASVGCCNKRCRTAFHFPCGLKNGAVFQFYGNYESFCCEHVVHPKIVLSRKEWVCPICTSPVMKRIEAIQSSCCKSAVFHKECLQKLALSSGYFFKCPMCNNGKEFVHEMRSLGIFVPEQDASWEREPNAYEDLYYQHSQCDVTDCLCPKGRSYSAQKGSWILARCRICGAAGTHKQCSNLTTVENWACEICLAVELRTEKDKEERVVKDILAAKAKQIKKKVKQVSSEDTDEEVYVSARSGNRKVRNGRLQKKLGKKSWNLSDLVVSPWCFWFFPYDKVRLEQFDAQSTLPDWRRLYLRVNLVNWIPKSLFEGVIDDSDIEDPIPAKVSFTNKSITDIDDEDRILISDSEIISKPIPVIKRKSLKIPRRRTRPTKTNWGRGVIRKKRQMQKKQLAELGSSTESSDLVDSTDASTAKVSKIGSPESQWDITNPEQVLNEVVLGRYDGEGIATTQIEAFSTIDMEISELKNTEPVWTTEDFEIDIQSSIEISCNDNKENKEGSMEVLSCTFETDDQVKTVLLNPCDVTPADCGVDPSTMDEIEMPNETITVDSESSHPLTELNTDISCSASPTKSPHQNTHEIDVETSENQEDLQAVSTVPSPPIRA